MAYRKRSDHHPPPKGYLSFSTSAIKTHFHLPAQSSEPRKFVGMVNSIADGYNLMKTLDLNSHNLQNTHTHIYI